MTKQSVSFPVITEFPVIGLNRATFISQITAWLKGTNYSKIFSDPIESEIDSTNAYLTSSISEELRIREISTDGVCQALGFRYDFPDEGGRLWRTEAVVKFENSKADSAILRLRTQCIANSLEANVETPKKPYLIKALILDGHAGVDGSFKVSDRPHNLEDSSSGDSIVDLISSGNASGHLPILYFSRTNEGNLALDGKSLDRLALKLGGIAHVVLEPSRSFSFRLKDRSDRRNPYDGTIGIFSPGKGLIRKFYLGGIFETRTKLTDAIEQFSHNLRSILPAAGWDWSELQESALRIQRERDKSLLSVAETEALYNEEISALRERIHELERNALSTSDALTNGYKAESDEIENLFSTAIPEIYDGETLDRLYYFARIVVESGENLGIDTRSRAVAEQILSWERNSPALTELKRNIDSATKDAKRSAKDIVSLLGRHGYHLKSENKHIRLEAEKMFTGLAPVTISKTPSDGRGLKNLKSQIEGALGITNLK